MFVSLGLVGPKSWPKGVDEGEQVNIPALGSLRLHLRGDAWSKVIPPLDVWVTNSASLGQVNPSGSYLAGSVRSLGN